MNFPNQFINWIMECVTTATFSVSINGMLYGFFHGKRGLRQGDPMSPMLFSSCLEYFSRLLNFTARSSAFAYHPLCKQLGITHLAYADDLMLFSHGDSRSVSIMMVVLAEFENTSGLTVNTQKSYIFSAGVHDNMLDFCGLPKGSLPIKYLGVPLDAKRLQISKFAPLYHKISQHVVNWKGHTLSYAGRLQLIKAVVQGVIGFWCQHFPIPDGVITHLNSLCGRFLWGKNLSSFSWNNVCLPVKERGLGILNFKAWNAAFLAKILWNIHNKKDTLWVKWVHHQYLSNNNLWDWSPAKSKVSHLMWSIIGVRNQLADKLGGVHNTIVELNKCNINGHLSTKHVYNILRPRGDSCNFIGAIWRGFIPPKQSFISWLALRNRLQTKDRLGDVILDNRCSFCHNATESTNHLFFACRFSCLNWDRIREWCGFQKCTIAIKSSIKWIKRLHKGTRIGSKRIILSLVCTIYHIWRARNAIIFYSNVLPCDTIIKCIIKDVCSLLYSLYPVQAL